MHNYISWLYTRHVAVWLYNPHGYMLSQQDKVHISTPMPSCAFNKSPDYYVRMNG